MNPVFADIAKIWERARRRLLGSRASVSPAGPTPTPVFHDIAKYWEWAHETTNISSLTGHALLAHLQWLAVEKLLRPDSHVLCIGVGTGVWVRELAERQKGGGSVTAVDISREALRRVSDVAATALPTTFYSDQIRDRFDLALSLWVAPHMKDDQLRDQLNAVIPALKSTGLFALQYNEPFPGTTYEEDAFIARYSTEAEALRCGMMRMTRDKFLSLVEAAGGRVLDWPRRVEAKDYDEVMYTAHIARA